MGVPGGFLFIAVLAIAVLVAVVVVPRRRRRTACAAWAAAHGWSAVRDDGSLTRRWTGPPFNAGKARRASEVLSARVGGRRALSFRYTVRTAGAPGDAQSAQDHEHHVVAVFLPATLPALSLTPGNLGTKIVTALGGQGLRFESAEFNSRWRVTSPDPRFAHDILHPRAIELLLRPEMVGLPLRFVGDAVLTWSVGIPRLDDIEPRVAHLNELVDAVPDYVWQDRTLPER